MDTVMQWLDKSRWNLFSMSWLYCTNWFDCPALISSLRTAVVTSPAMPGQPLSIYCLLTDTRSNELENTHK